MAENDADLSYHGVLVANQQDGVTIRGFAQRIEVMNRSGTAEIVFNFTGDAIASTNPPSPDTYVLPAVVGASFIMEGHHLYQATVEGESYVSLKSSGTPTYSVTRLPEQKRIRD